MSFVVGSGEQQPSNVSTNQEGALQGLRVLKELEGVLDGNQKAYFLGTVVEYSSADQASDRGTKRNRAGVETGKYLVRFDYGCVRQLLPDEVIECANLHEEFRQVILGYRAKPDGPDPLIISLPSGSLEGNRTLARQVLVARSNYWNISQEKLESERREYFSLPENENKPRPKRVMPIWTRDSRFGAQHAVESTQAENIVEEKKSDENTSEKAAQSFFDMSPRPRITASKSVAFNTFSNAPRIQKPLTVDQMMGNARYYQGSASQQILPPASRVRHTSGSLDARMQLSPGLRASAEAAANAAVRAAAKLDMPKEREFSRASQSVSFTAPLSPLDALAHIAANTGKAGEGHKISTEALKVPEIRADKSDGFAPSIASIAAAAAEKASSARPRSKDKKFLASSLSSHGGGGGGGGAIHHGAISKSDISQLIAKENAVVDCADGARNKRKRDERNDFLPQTKSQKSASKGSVDRHFPTDSLPPPTLNRQNSAGSQTSFSSAALLNKDFDKTPRTLEKMPHRLSGTPHTFEQTPRVFTPGSRLTPSTLDRAANSLFSPSDTPSVNPAAMSDIYNQLDNYMASGPKSPGVAFRPRKVKANAMAPQTKAGLEGAMQAPAAAAAAAPPKKAPAQEDRAISADEREKLLKQNRARIAAGVEPYPVPPVVDTPAGDQKQSAGQVTKLGATKPEAAGREKEASQPDDRSGRTNFQDRQVSVQGQVQQWHSDGSESDMKTDTAVMDNRQYAYDDSSDSDSFAWRLDRGKPYGRRGDYGYDMAGSRHAEQGRGFRHHPIYGSRHSAYGAHMLAFDHDSDGRRGLELRDPYGYRQPRRGADHAPLRHHRTVEFGHPREEVMEGEQIYSRHTLFLWGAHKSEISPVNGTPAEGCDSLMFTGADAIEPSRKDEILMFKYKCSQRNGAGALFTNHKEQLPLRVFRRTKGGDGMDGFRYDGLYTVIAVFDDEGRPRSELSGKSKFFTFLLRRNSSGGRTRYSNRVLLDDLWDLFQHSKGSSGARQRPRGDAGGGGGGATGGSSSGSGSGSGSGGASGSRSKSLHVPSLGDGRGHGGGIHHGLGVGNLGVSGVATGPGTPQNLQNSVLGKNGLTGGLGTGGLNSPMSHGLRGVPPVSGSGVGLAAPKQVVPPGNPLGIHQGHVMMAHMPTNSFGRGGIMAHAGLVSPMVYGNMMAGYGGPPGFVASSSGGNMFGVHDPSYPGGRLAFSSGVSMDPKLGMGTGGPMPGLETSSPLLMGDKSHPLTRKPFSDVIASGGKKSDKTDKTTAKSSPLSKSDLIGVKNVFPPVGIPRAQPGPQNVPSVPVDTTFGMRSPDGNLRPMSAPVGYGNVLPVPMGVSMGGPNIGYMPYPGGMGPPMDWSNQHSKRS